VIFAGIDIGSRAAKAVIINDGSILSSVIRDTGPESVKTANMAIEEALKGPVMMCSILSLLAMGGYWFPSLMRISPR